MQRCFTDSTIVGTQWLLTWGIHPKCRRELVYHERNERGGCGRQGIHLSPPTRFSLERAIKFIAPDELVEATPKSIRLSKRTLDHQQRMREVKKMKDLAENT